jgi:hypothetical protein
MRAVWRILALITLLSGPGLAQDAPTPDTPPDTPPVDIGGAPKVTTPAAGGTPTRTVRIIRTPTLDYAAWEEVAMRAEEQPPH